MLPLLVLLGTIAGAWYLLIVRPQKDQQTRHGRLVERLQVGDHVLTIGGIYGRVAALETSTVVLELAPGLTSRISTDGIARIVQGAEAALPTSTTDAGTPMPATREAMDDQMHEHTDQHPHQQQPPAPAAPPQFAPAAVLPPQPFAAQPAAPVAAPAQAMTTLRAQVEPQLPTFEPRPWPDAAPRSASHPVGQQPLPVHTPFAPAGEVQYAQPVQYAPPVPVQYAQPQHHAHPIPPAQYAHHAQPQQYAHHAQPQQYAPPMLQQHPQPVQQAPQPQQHDVAEPEAERRYSRAPKGMGSSLRLDDPSLRDTIARAREERAGLAEEYRKLTAPLVQVEEPGHAQHAAHAAPHGHAQPQLVGHGPDGVPLFATPGVPGVHPIAQYPTPAPVPVDASQRAAAAMPRPVFQPIAGEVDPALRGSAFQRRTPWSPDQPVAAHA